MCRAASGGCNWRGRRIRALGWEERRGLREEVGEEGVEVDHAVVYAFNGWYVETEAMVLEK